MHERAYNLRKIGTIKRTFMTWGISLAFKGTQNTGVLWWKCLPPRTQICPFPAGDEMPVVLEMQSAF